MVLRCTTNLKLQRRYNLKVRNYRHKLLSAIRKNGWRNKDVVKNTGIKPARFSRIVTGIYDPTQDERQKISKFLRTPQKDLF